MRDLFGLSIPSARPWRIKRIRHAGLAALLGATVGGLGLGSSAQAQTADASGTTTTEEVVITGSRIEGTTNANSPSPVSVITADDIRKTSAANIEDVLTRMTGVDFSSGGVSNSNVNGGTGLSVADLRGLGPARTLVLIDGVRLISTYSGTTEVTDLSSVPISMIDRIEVLRDGASSVYGADAIGGVINIITKRHEEGLQLDGSYGQTSKNDGFTHNLAGTMGFNTDKGNILVALSWDHADPIQNANRAWAVDPHLNGGSAEGGSTYRSQLDVLQDAGSSGNIWVNGALHSVFDPSIAGLLPNDVYLPGAGKYKLNAGAPGWNYLTQGIDRKQISLNSHYDFNDQVSFILEGFFTDRQAEGSQRPEPLLNTQIGTGAFPGFIVPAWEYTNNPAGPNLVANLTPDQFGPRRYDDDSRTYRLHYGLQGNVLDNYHWEAGFVDQHNSTVDLTHNEGNFNNLMQILGLTNCVDVPGGCTAATAAQTAASVAAGLPGVTSVPLVVPHWTQGPNNIFTQAQLNYLLFDNPDYRTSSEEVAYADINGPLFKLPAGDVKGALGVERRSEYLTDDPNLTVQEVGPNASQPTAGGYNVKSIYAEVNAPLLKDDPFVKELSVDLSGRYDKYSTFGSAKTYKFGVDYAPIEDFRIRATILTGFRAPNVAELYGGTAITDLPANGDPCDTRAAGLNGNTNVGKGVLSAGSNCSKAVAGGAAVTNFTPTTDDSTPTQQQVQVGGNPNLQPEKSNQYGVGFVVTPRFTPGLTFTADYYNIKITNTVLTSGIVGATNVDTVLLGCYGPTQNAAYCSLIQRTSAGVINQINSLATSFGVARVTGTDFQLTYDTAKAGHTLPFAGDMVFNLQATDAYTNTQTNADGSVSSYIGTFQDQANESITPKWKGLASLDYNIGNWGVHWDTTFIEHMSSYDIPDDTDYGNTLPTYYLHAASASYTVENIGQLKKLTVTAGVNNVFNKDPPFLNFDTICKCNSVSGQYDFIGRYLYGRVSAKF